MKTGEVPYKDLYIYLLSGVVTEWEEQDLGDEFVGNWVEDDCSFLFFGRSAGDDVARLINTRPDLELIETHHFTYDQWQGGGFSGLKVAGFVIAPPWQTHDPDEQGVRIVLDPGVVFGNGLHPTTGDCLRAIALANETQPLIRLLDLGTGTGILALAAALSGAQSVLAVDINPLCVRTAIRNVNLNGLGNIIEVVKGRAEDFGDDLADMVVANIHHEVIKRLVEDGGFRNARRLIISGLLRSQFFEVRAQIEKDRFKVLRQWDYEMTWFTLLAQRKGNNRK
ncbi:Ribosomal protein L11 methyltransferase [uncultured Desulfobacterium sp.]|uniref:Ribosomal protein L11 methyltransferase n=1 Tax=uncultured Desulfobacterium sp. TaxID=201089 RepID=A0A445MSE7_9BACT|nr:Ribosomal protein L11 methyltransferase [uncultured Desulfobacterium sp.]